MTRKPGSWRRPHRQQMNLLLVGSEDAFKNDIAERLFEGERFRVVARSSALLEALACLESGAIDLVLLSREYREEEVGLFASDARRRGFAGLILRTTDAAGRVPGIEPQDTGPIQIGDFFIEVASHRVWIRGVETQCRPLEFELLRFLCTHPDVLLSQGTLLELLWGNPATSPHSLRVLIRAVRAKIETTTPPRYIGTLRKFGYRFIPSRQPMQ